MIVHCCIAPKDKLHDEMCFVILSYVSDVFFLRIMKDYFFLFIQGYIIVVLAMNCQKI